MITNFQLKNLNREARKKISEMKIGQIPGVEKVKADLNTGREISKEEVGASLSGTDYRVM